MAVADIYVWQGASGSNNGTDWTNAYTSIETAENNAAANDLIWVHYTHNEGSPTGASWNFLDTANVNAKLTPIKFISVDKDDNGGRYRRGARLYANTDFIIGTASDAGGYFKGFDFEFANTASGEFTPTVDTFLEFDDCKIIKGTGALSTDEIQLIGDQRTAFINCEWSSRTNTGPLARGIVGHETLRNISIANTSVSVTDFWDAHNTPGVYFHENFNIEGNNITSMDYFASGPNVAQGPVYLTLANSKVPATFNFPGFTFAEPGSRYEAYNIASGGGHLHGLIINTYQGTIVDDVGTYLNGNVNGTNFSLKFSTNGNTAENFPLCCRLGEFWANGNSTIKINFTSNTNLDASEVYLLFEFPSDVDVQKRINKNTKDLSKLFGNTNVANLVTNSETWTNGMNNKYEISYTITGGSTGPHAVYFYLVPHNNASIDVYVDPEPVIS